MFLGELRPYQKEAVDRMVEERRMLVSYDMGLGKTPMTLAAIERLFDDGVIQHPVLVLCLSGLKYQWKSQGEKFTDSKFLVIDGTPTKRAAQYASILTDEGYQYDYVIMNYESLLTADWDIVRKMRWGAVICDEATFIKSFKAKRTKRVKGLAAKSPVRFALTGTPVENGAYEEIFSIMEFVDPDILGDWWSFDQRHIVRNYFGAVDRYIRLPELHEQIRTGAVRKSQKDPDVAPHLPQVIDREPTWIYLDRKGAALYEQISTSILEDFDQADEEFGPGWLTGGSDHGGPADQFRGKIMSKVTCLRMLCDHPDLLRISGNKFLDPDVQGGSEYAAHLVSTGALDGVTKSPKLEWLVKYVRDFLDTDDQNKAVIFSAFVPTTDFIAERLGPEHCVTFTGAMSAKEQEAARLAFKTDPKIRVLISSDAGGFGVDLPEGNLLINYDLPWSAGKALQRNSRIIRASSEWSHVVLDYLLIAGSLEERQLAALQRKREAGEAAIDGLWIDQQGGLDMDLQALRRFLAENSPRVLSG